MDALVLIFALRRRLTSPAVRRRCASSLAPRATHAAAGAARDPHGCGVGAKLFRGHSGQPVQDMLKHADYAASAAARGATRAFNDGASCVDRHVDGDDDAYLACLEDTLWWRVLAPTAPDTLPS